MHLKAGASHQERIFISLKTALELDARTALISVLICAGS